MEWLVEAMELDEKFDGRYSSTIAQALEMERQRLEEAYIVGRKECHLDFYPEKHAREYYNETYGGNKQ